MDKYHGQGGTYEVVNGERRLVKDSTLEHHADGDGARDEDGNDAGVKPAAEAQPAMPEAQKAPWEQSTNPVNEAHDA